MLWSCYYFMKDLVLYVQKVFMKIPVIRLDTPRHTDMDDICKLFRKKQINKLVHCLCEILDNPNEPNMIVERAYKK